MSERASASEAEPRLPTADMNTPGTTPQLIGAVEGVVLAGAHSWGDCPLERVVMRPLVPIVGRPLITHILTWFRAAGIPDVTVCAHGDAAVLRRALTTGSALGVDIEYYQDLMPRGPAGCVRDATQECRANLIVVAEATIIPRVDLSKMLLAHRASGAALTVVSTRLNHDGNHGSAVLTPAGIYICSREALAHVPATGFQDIKETLIPRLSRMGHLVTTQIVDSRLVPRVLGSATYLAAGTTVLEEMGTDEVCPRGYTRNGAAWIHESARVEPQARLLGPLWIDRDCEIGPGALVIGPTTIGAGSHISAGAVVSRSILWKKCHIGAQATLDHCVLTDDSVIAAGVALRNVVRLGSVREHGVTWLERMIGYRLPRSRQRAGRAGRAASEQDAATQGTALGEPKDAPVVSSSHSERGRGAASAV